MPDLPQGFRIVGQGNAPQLPQGFRVVQPAQQTQQVEQPAQQEPFRPPELFPGSNAFQTGWLQSLTGEFGDEIISGMGTPVQMGIDAFQGKPLDVGRSFNTQLEQNRAAMAEHTEGHPTATAVGNVGGALNLGGLLAKGGVTLMNGASPTVASLLGRGALEGAAYGGVYGAGADEGGLEDKLNASGWGALWGALFGGAAGGASGKLASNAAQRAIPSERALSQQADDLYRAAEQNGVMATQQQTQQLAGQLRQIASDEGLITPAGRVTGNPNIQHILNSVDDYANGTMSVPQMQAVRKLFRDAAGSSDAGERRLGSIMLQKFDDFTAPLAPELSQARDAYTRLMKSREIGTLVDRAELNAGRYSQSGLENALRQEFRTLSRKIVSGQSRGFSPEEAQAIREVADGGPMANFFRMVGKFAPRGVISTGLSTGVPFAIGSAFGGPAAGATAAGGTMMAGEASRAVATALARQSANKAGNIMRSGGRNTMQQIPQSTRDVIQALLVSGGSQSPKVPGGAQTVPHALSSLM